MADLEALNGISDINQTTRFLENSPQKDTVIGQSRGDAEDDHPPADGGTRAWLVMLGSFFCNGILFGVINSYGVLYNDFNKALVADGVTHASGKAALAGSLAMGMTFFISPVSGILTDYIGIRKTTFFGGLIASCGMLLSSFCTHDVTLFCITFGVMYGLGGALAYTPSLAVLGHYFKQYLGIVNGIVTAGSSVFTITMPYVLDALLKNFGLVWTLRSLSAFASLIMLVAILFKPVNKSISIKKVSVKDVFNMSVITNVRYLIWTAVIGLCLFGYFVPYVYMISFVETNFSGYVDKNLPVLCIGVTSGVSRLVFGYLIDRTNVNKILLQQLAFFTLGILTILLAFSVYAFPLLLFICLGMGITDGCFITLLGPIAFELCGRDGGAQAIGFLLGVCSLPLTLGPYFAGLIYDSQKSYTLPFILAGINPTLASFGLLAIKCVRQQQSKNADVQHPLNPDLSHRKTVPEKLALENARKPFEDGSSST
ncbi:monocarboxylate transporter 10 isoform X1 [Dendroctonus ponderosae]|uniref:monocarboxylate transporter 10 isoform X1 n=1 Tax=Dendroctonus ponderosae TaxID=77166 RepID=UPI0020353EAD|nr:monocarboxylate transporter 10 isoform X1 [Dendroctonus ponderosae]